MDDLRSRVDAVNWFHTIDLGNGIVTPGRDDSASRLARMQIPDDLTGMSVLDVGAWDGYFSFEAERRGAARVLAIDSFSWEGGGWGSKAGFELAHEARGSSVESQTIDVLDLSPETVGLFECGHRRHQRSEHQERSEGRDHRHAALHDHERSTAMVRSHRCVYACSTWITP